MAMKVKNHFKLIAGFYSSFAMFTIIVSFASWLLAGSPTGDAFWRFFPMYILLKIVTNALVWYYLRLYNRNRLYFYFNLGISEIKLAVQVFAIDFIAFIAPLFFIHLFIG
jgi:hypothetical protein